MMVLKVFRTLGDLFGNKFNNHFPDSKREQSIISWGNFLNDISEEQIDHALTIEMREWQKDTPPTLPQFRQMCLKKIVARETVQEFDYMEEYSKQATLCMELLQKIIYPELSNKKLEMTRGLYWSLPEHKGILKKLDDLIISVCRTNDIAETNRVLLGRLPEGLKVIRQVKYILEGELQTELAERRKSQSNDRVLGSAGVAGQC